VHGAGGSSQATRDRICGLFCGSGPLAAVRSAIVYCAFKDDANQLARLMCARGINTRAYHAGKDHRVRANLSESAPCAPTLPGMLRQAGHWTHVPVPLAARGKAA
jgi:hypothetical protein